MLCTCNIGKTVNTAIEEADELKLEEGLAEDEI